MTLILSADDVRDVLALSGGAVLDDLLNRVRDAYAQLADGRVRQHPRIFLRDEKSELQYPPGLFTMSALAFETGYMGARLQGLTNPLGGGDGVLVLFDYGTGRCLSVIDNSHLHGCRSGAPAAIAAELLARKESEVVAVIGSGPIAAGGLLMTHRALPGLTSARVYSPTQSHRERFAVKMSEQLGIEVVAVGSSDDAVRDADVIITGTDAYRPVIADEAIAKGTHISLLARNEIEMSTFERARVTRGSEPIDALDPPWKYPIPVEWIDNELSDLVAGRADGRQSDDELTVFFVGGIGPLAMWDMATAAAVYERAERAGIGTQVAFAG